MNNQMLNFFRKYNLYNHIKKGGKGLYIYRIEDEITKKATDTIKTKDDEDMLTSKIKDIEEKFKIDNSSDFDLELDLKKLDQIDIDEDKIRKEAEDELQDFKTSSLNKINNEKVSKENELKSDKDSIIKSTENSKNELKKEYDNVREKVSNDALKRGLQRSSIVINVLDAFNKDEINNYKKLDEKLNDNINAINFELNALTTKQQQALEEFDITYAAKLNNRINELTNDLKEKQEEIIKYNNEIAKTEEDYRIKFENLKNDLNDSNFNKELDLVEVSAKYGINAVKKYKESLVYDTVKEYISNMDRIAALEFLTTNKYVQEQLGSYYKILLDELQK